MVHLLLEVNELQISCSTCLVLHRLVSAFQSVLDFCFDVWHRLVAVFDPLYLGPLNSFHEFGSKLTYAAQPLLSPLSHRNVWKAMPSTLFYYICVSVSHTIDFGHQTSFRTTDVAIPFDCPLLCQPVPGRFLACLIITVALWRWRLSSPKMSSARGAVPSPSDSAGVWHRSFVVSARQQSGLVLQSAVRLGKQRPGKGAASLLPSGGPHPIDEKHGGWRWQTSAPRKPAR